MTRWGRKVGKLYVTPEAKRMEVVKQFKDRWVLSDQLSQLVVVVEDNP